MKILFAILAIFALARSGSFFSVVQVPSDDVETFRLPNNTRPIRYDIQLTTDIHRAEFNFSGVVRILIEALENTSEITLHYRQITIDTVNLWSSAETPVLLEGNITPALDERLEFIRIPTAEELVAHEHYIVEVEYNGILREDNFGFLRASYRDSDGETRWLATTQFQPTDARHAFPCYDEPAIRAIYSLEVRHHVTYYVISNMPVESVRAEDVSGYYITRFEDTPTVQTYILGFVVSDFESMSRVGEIYHRLSAKPASIFMREADFGLETAEIVLTAIENYLNMTYPMTKKDLIAVPDFAYGAQNWGICVYREEFLLFNPELGTQTQLFTIKRLLAHEYIVSILKTRDLNLPSI